MSEEQRQRKTIENMLADVRGYADVNGVYRVKETIVNAASRFAMMIAAARQDEREKLRLAFRPLLVRPTMYFGDPIDKDQLLAEFDAAIDRLTPRKEDVT